MRLQLFVALVVLAASCGGGTTPTSLVGIWRITSMTPGTDGDPSTCVARTSTSDVIFAADMTLSTLNTTVFSADASLCGGAGPARAGCTETARGSGQMWSMMSSSESARAITTVTISGPSMGSNETTGCADPSRNRPAMSSTSPDRAITVEYRADADTMIFQGAIYHRVAM